MLELLRQPPKPLQVFYLGMLLFIAAWAGVVAGQVPEDRGGLATVIIYGTYAALSVVILAFSVEYSSIKLHIGLCFITSLIFILFFWMGFNSVNETEARTWYEPLIMFGFATLMVFPMLAFSAVFYGFGKLAEHLRILPPFLRT